jgi:DNA-binding XRE family transcriptional regulator
MLKEARIEANLTQEELAEKQELKKVISLESKEA